MPSVAINMHSKRFINQKEPAKGRKLKVLPISEDAMKEALLKLDPKEEVFVRDLEKAKSRKRGHLTVEEERRLFGIYKRFSQRADELKECLNAGKANGEEPEMKKELASVERQRRRIFDIIVLTNYGLVCMVASKIIKKHLVFRLEFQDLVQEGIFGVMKDVDRFDLERGYKFSTYASWQIRAFVDRAIKNQERTVRLSVHANDVLTKIYVYIRDFSIKNRQHPTLAEIAEGTGYKEEKIRYLLDLKPDAPLLELDGNTSDQHSDSSFDCVASGELREIMVKWLAKLEPREREVIERHFGLNERNGEEETLEQIGRSMHLSRERIRQIEAMTINKLRRIAARGGLRDFA